MKVEDKSKLVKSSDADPNIVLDLDTDKTSGRYTSDNLPDTIVIHYTGGTTLGGAQSTLQDPNVKASAHLLVDYDGSIVQLVPFSHIAWHAGKSNYNGRSGFNKYSIGIEIVNPGYLVKTGNNEFRTAYGHTVEPENAALLRHKNENEARYWHEYKEAQLVVTEKICFALKAAFPIQYILGHDEISPKRKTDPGPCFPIESLRGKILDLRSMDDDDFPDTGVVAVDNLNIRANASASADKVAKPLKKDAIVHVLEEKDGWYKVKTEITGWVSAQYIS